MLLSSLSLVVVVVVIFVIVGCVGVSLLSSFFSLWPKRLIEQSFGNILENRRWLWLLWWFFLSTTPSAYLKGRENKREGREGGKGQKRRKTKKEENKTYPLWDVWSRWTSIHNTHIFSEFSTKPIVPLLRRWKKIQSKRRGGCARERKGKKERRKKEKEREKRTSWKGILSREHLSNKAAESITLSGRLGFFIANPTLTAATVCVGEKET